jgi:hypothetical protein
MFSSVLPTRPHSFDGRDHPGSIKYLQLKVLELLTLGVRVKSGPPLGKEPRLPIAEQQLYAQTCWKMQLGLVRSLLLVQKVGCNVCRTVQMDLRVQMSFNVQAPFAALSPAVSALLRINP